MTGLALLLVAFPLAEVERAAVAFASVDRTRFLDDLFASVTAGAETHAERAEAVRRFVRDTVVHDRVDHPLDAEGQSIHDPVMVLALGRAWCGVKSRLVVDILEAGGYRGRIVQGRHHQAAEIRWSGRWHLVDPYVEPIPGADGEPASVWWLCRDPWAATRHGFSISPALVFCDPALPRTYYVKPAGRPSGLQYGWGEVLSAPARDREEWDEPLTYCGPCAEAAP